MQTVWTIAGYDPSSGAGVTADLLVFAAHGLFGCSAITALTVQSTMGVASVQPIAASLLRATLEHLAADLPPVGIKIGMLATAENVVTVADFLVRHPAIPAVLDPVLRSSSGRALLSRDGVEAMREQLLPLVDWVTPNLDELAVLTGEDVSEGTIAAAGATLLARHPQLTLLVTGGDLAQPDDLLLLPGGAVHWLRGERIETMSTHGTGCALSSALLSRLVLGEEPQLAALAAKAYVAEAMRRATPRGRGRGPLNHLWPLQSTVAPQ